MIEKIKKFIRIITTLVIITFAILIIYYEWKNILCFVGFIMVLLIICWAFDW